MACKRCHGHNTVTKLVILVYYRDNILNMAVMGHTIPSPRYLHESGLVSHTVCVFLPRGRKVYAMLNFSQKLLSFVVLFHAN